MKDVKAQRLERGTWVIWTQRWAVLDTVGKDLLDRYHAKHPEMTLYGLHIADLALEEEVRNIMCKPPDVVVAKEQFLALEGAVKVIADRWQTRVSMQFGSLLAKGKIAAPKNIDVLTLATTIFSVCDWPRTHKEFPEVVGNHAVRHDQGCVGEDAYKKFVCARYGSHYAGCTGTDIRPVKHKNIMRTIVEICGKDPDKATAAEMDALDVRLISVAPTIARNWRSAVSSFYPSGLLMRRIHGPLNRCAALHGPKNRSGALRLLKSLQNSGQELEVLRTLSKVWCTPTTRDYIEEHWDSEYVQHYRSCLHTPWISWLHNLGMVYVRRISRNRTCNTTGPWLRAS